MIDDAIEKLLRGCGRRPLILRISRHPYITGQPHPALHLGRVLTRLMEAADQRIR